MNSSGHIVLTLPRPAPENRRLRRHENLPRALEGHNELVDYRAVAGDALPIDFQRKRQRLAAIGLGNDDQIPRTDGG